MFTSLAASKGDRRPPDSARLHGALTAAPIILVLVVVGVASAEPPSRALRLSAADVARSGAGIGLVPHEVAGEVVLEVIAERGGAAADPGSSLLAVAPGGEAAALADRLGEPSGVLTLARSDGSQLRISLPGLMAASFSPDGRRVLVVDGRGSLWQVDAESGEALALGDGPFLGPPIVLADGSLLLLAVPSVEAPYRARLVRFDPATGVATRLGADELVYAAFPLDDGSVAVVAHEPGRTVVRRIAIGDSASTLVADLGADAVNATVSADGRTIAFEVSGSGIFVIDHPAADPRRLGDGANPCLARDGRALLVGRGTSTLVLALDGSMLAELGGAARFVGSAGCSS